MSGAAPRPYILAETNWKTVREADYRLAVLPWGATEAHNFHLPYATDNLQVEAIACQAARRAWEQVPQVVVLPGVPFGVNTGQLDVDLCLNMNPSTQLAVLADLADVLLRAGLDKLVILNGHGGNQFKPMIRELAGDFPDLFVCAVNWWEAGLPTDIFDEPGDHAGEMETSMMLHLHPHWVLPLSEAGDGAARQFKVAALREGWATAQRQWTQVTRDTGVGNPQFATAEKGQQFFDRCSERIGDFLAQLAPLSLHELYED